MFSLLSAVSVVQAQDGRWFLSSADSLYGARLEGLIERQIADKFTLPESDSPLIVAVIDGGLDISHPGIASYLYTNQGEIPGDGVDNDGNGYADDVHGWNFLGNESGINLTEARTETFRQYRMLYPRYNYIDPTSLTGEELEDYNYYKYVEAWAKLDWLKEFASACFASKAITVCDSLMQLRYGECDTLTVADFLSMEIADTTGIGDYLTMVYQSDFITKPRTPWREVVLKAFDDYSYAARYAEQPNVREPDAHMVIGNNPDDFDDFHYGNPNIAEQCFHGTSVVGVIVSCIESAGLPADRIKIMHIRAVPRGDEYDRDVAAAIRYAVDNGAKVINMSFGKYFSQYSREVLKAIYYAEDRDVFIVKAAGNEGYDNVVCYPRCRNDKGLRHSNMIVTGASTPDGMIAPFSNLGHTSVDILAPGVNMFTASQGGRYENVFGTSFSAPLVAGTAAILRSCFPRLSARQLRKILMGSVRDISRVEMPAPKTLSDNLDYKYRPTIIKGRQTCVSGGILDAEKAFRAARKLKPEKNRK